MLYITKQSIPQKQNLRRYNITDTNKKVINEQINANTNVT